MKALERLVMLGTHTRLMALLMTTGTLRNVFMLRLADKKMYCIVKASSGGILQDT